MFLATGKSPHDTDSTSCSRRRCRCESRRGDNEPIPRPVTPRLKLGGWSRSSQQDRIPSFGGANCRQSRTATRAPRIGSGGATALDACKLLNEPNRPTAKLTWDDVRDIREQANAGVPQSELAIAFHISRPLCNEIVRGRIWNPDVKVSTGDEMRDRIIGALDTGCRRGEMLKIQNKHVDWQHRRIRILKEHSKTEVARGIPFEAGSRFEGLLRKRAFLGPDAYVFGEATTGAYVASCESAWQTLLLLANGIKPSRAGSGKRVSNRDALARIDLHWHDCGMKRCRAWRTMAFRFTNCRCWPDTPASPRLSVT